MEEKEHKPLDASLCTRRNFLERFGAASGVVAVARVTAKAVPTGKGGGSSTGAQGRLFPAGLPELAWHEFSARGFSGPVSGVICRPGKAPCCGAPLGGISTGCIDINVDGVYGYNSIFNPVSPCPIAKGMRMPRKMPTFQPLLGLSVQGRTIVLTTQEILQGGEVSACLDPFFGHSYIKEIRVPISKLEGVEPAKEINYWGHFPRHRYRI